MITFNLGQISVTLVTGCIWTEPAMGMIYRYRDISGVAVDAVSCSSSFRGIDITRAVSKHFRLPEPEFEHAGRLCNERLEVCAIQHTPMIILTPRSALYEKYTANDAKHEMNEILTACSLVNANSLRLCHFAMLTSDDAFSHMPGVREGIKEWTGEYPSAIYFDAPNHCFDRIASILRTKKPALAVRAK